jgi:hypothetical protein
LKISEIQLVALVKEPTEWMDTNVEVEGGQTTGEVTLVSADDLYGGNPSGTLAYQDAQPGLWTIMVPTTALGALSECIEDLIILVTYEITVKSGLPDVLDDARG